MSVIKTHQDLLKQELTKWQELVERNVSLQKRLELADIEAYLQKALKVIETQPKTN